MSRKAAETAAREERRAAEAAKRAASEAAQRAAEEVRRAAEEDMMRKATEAAAREELSPTASTMEEEQLLGEIAQPSLGACVRESPKRKSAIRKAPLPAEAPSEAPALSTATARLVGALAAPMEPQRPTADADVANGAGVRRSLHSWPPALVRRASAASQAETTDAPTATSASSSPAAKEVASWSGANEGLQQASEAALPSPTPAPMPRKPKALALILGVDQTLVHCITSEGTQQQIEDLAMLATVDDATCAEEDVHEWDGHWIKLRPGVRDFLARMHEHYELCLFSKGTPSFVEHIRGILDPDRIFFARRVACAADVNIDIPKIRIVTSKTNDQIVIFDDDILSWEDEVVKLRAFPYKWFLEPRTALFLNDAAGATIAPDRDAHLDCVARLLHDIAVGVEKGAKTTPPLSLRSIQDMAFERVFKNLSIFVDEPIADVAAGSLHYAASLYGASVHTEVHSGLHLVVYAENDLDVLQKARQLNLFIVHVRWLYFCFATYGLQDLRPFMLKHLDANHRKRSEWDVYTDWFEAKGKEAPSVVKPHPGIYLNLEKSRKLRLKQLGQQGVGVTASE